MKKNIVLAVLALALVGCADEDVEHERKEAEEFAPVVVESSFKETLVERSAVFADVPADLLEDGAVSACESFEATGVSIGSVMAYVDGFTEGSGGMWGQEESVVFLFHATDMHCPDVHAQIAGLL